MVGTHQIVQVVESEKLEGNCYKQDGETHSFLMKLSAEEEHL